jgi:chemotaxis protein methyltransferase CheR
MIIPSPTSTAEAIPLLGYGDYMRFGQLAHDCCGLHFPEKRYAELERGVRQAFAASTCANLDEYYSLLQDPQNDAAYMEQLLNALTISETHFFRDAAQFDALYYHVLPQIIERRRPLRTLRIWSAGCASGEEPYSIAMLLRELLPDVDEWSITILGSDVNTEALARARKAVYSNWAFREERARQWQVRYFHSRDSHYELIPEVRRMVTFARLNLAQNAYPAYETNTTLLDLILCRNVTIYFTESVTRQIVDRFYAALVDDGWLAVGHSEHSIITYRHFQARNFPSAILYQRAGQPTPRPQDWETLFEQKPAPRTTAAPALTPATSAQPDLQPSPVLQARVPADADPLEHARELIEYGHSEQARDQLLELVKSRPRHTPTCTLLGQAYANLGCWPEAEQWCREAIQSDKLAIEAYYTLALVLQHQGKLEQATDAMKKVVYIDRHNVPGHFGLAELYHASDQLPRALKSLDNARHLLEGSTDDALVPGSGGITVGRLRETIVRQQQQWSAAASGS